MFKDYPRWIFASATKHFNDLLADDVYIEGTFQQSQDWRDYYEIRFNGPHFEKISNGFWGITFTVDVLIVSVMGDDFHKIHKMAGEVVAAFTTMGLFKYGDDDSFITCAKLASKQIEVNHFGRIDNDIPIIQASVQGTYKFNITI